jgi:lipopolysaccharide/colanic/teichoic acid biosynthesis glycosyltransferase
MKQSPSSTRASQSGARLLLKRAADITCAACGLLLLSPLLLVAALLIRLPMGAPVIFQQERPGRFGHPFLLLKLRTMNAACDRQGRPLPDSERLTRLGRILRATSLDELPQLWNVIRGEMSLVGPRPLLMEYLPRYTSEQARRHDVLPGITGWAQVNGRNALTWEEKFALDVWYVDHWSLQFDFTILLTTARIVCLRQGISNKSHATMPEFLGSSQQRTQR